MLDFNFTSLYAFLDSVYNNIYYAHTYASDSRFDLSGRSQYMYTNIHLPNYKSFRSGCVSVVHNLIVPNIELDFIDINEDNSSIEPLDVFTVFKLQSSSKSCFLCIIGTNGKLYINRQCLKQIYEFDENVRIKYLEYISNIIEYHEKIIKKCMDAELYNTFISEEYYKQLLVDIYNKLIVYKVNLTIDDINDSLTNFVSDLVVPNGGGISGNLVNIFTKTNDVLRMYIKNLLEQHTYDVNESKKNGMSIGFKLISALYLNGYKFDENRDCFYKPVNIQPNVYCYSGKWYKCNIHNALGHISEILFYPTLNAQLDSVISFNVTGSHPNVSSSGVMCLGYENTDKIKDLLNSNESTVQDYLIFLSGLEKTLDVVNFDSSYVGISNKIMKGSEIISAKTDQSEEETIKTEFEEF